jgi:hypothetical protein
MTTATAPTARAARGALGGRAAMTGLANEVGKGLLFVWRERTQILIEIPMWLAVFLLLNAITGSGQQLSAGGRLDFTNATHATTRFVGFAAFIFFYCRSPRPADPSQAAPATYPGHPSKVEQAVESWSGRARG